MTKESSDIVTADNDVKNKGQSSESLWSLLLERMHPRTCLTAVQDYVESEDTLEEIMPGILRDIQEDRSVKRQQKALNQLYEVSDVKHKENRTTLVSQYKILNPLLNCIKEHPKMTCLILNNLSIPYDNKRIMVQSERLLNALLETMRPLPQEAYLVCICLMNLSFWQESHYKLMYYCPCPPNLVLENPLSLLKTMERMLVTFVPLLAQTTKLSVEGEAVRWAAGLLRNLVSEQHTHHHAKLVSETKLPYCLLRVLKESRRPLSQWKTDTMEDLCLQVVLNLAKWPESCRRLQKLQAQSYLQHIEGQGGIHDMRASWIRCSLESLK